MFKISQTEPARFSKAKFSPGVWELKFEDGSTVELRPADLAASLGIANVNSVRFSGPELELNGTRVDLLPFVPEKYKAAYSAWKDTYEDVRVVPQVSSSTWAASERTTG
jgi:hypothetical protein